MTMNQMIDHTLLKADATQAEVEKLCSEAKTHGFKSVCLQPYWVSLAAKILVGSQSVICTVIGFPLGANTSTIKAAEAKEAVANGAAEVDMVINIGELKAGHDNLVQADIQAVVEAVPAETVVKVIIESCLLTEEEIVRVSKMVVAAGAEFVKTSTGFSTGGATIAAVKLIKATVGNRAEVKASGGVRTSTDAESMVTAGATRIGTSNGIAIVS